MTEFTVNNHYVVRCESYAKGQNWGHKADLLKNGIKVCSARIRYSNRTWESYPFKSVYAKVLWKSKLFTDDEINEATSKYEYHNS